MAANTGSPLPPGLRTAVLEVPVESVQPCSFNRSSELEGEAVLPFTKSIEAFVAKLSAAAAGCLGFGFEVALKSSEQVTHPALAEKMPAASYMLSLSMRPHYGTGVLQIEHSLLFPVVDVLLGGTANSSSLLSRDITEIEEKIAQELVRLIAGELQSSWRQFGVEEVAPGSRCLPDQLGAMLPEPEKALLFSFSVTMPEAAGSFSVLVPGSSATAMLRKLSKERASRVPVPKKSARHAERLLACSFGSELAITATRVRASDLIHLKVGDVIKLRVPVRTPACLVLGGRGAYEAHPVRSGGHRAAQLGARLPAGPHLTGEAK